MLRACTSTASADMFFRVVKVMCPWCVVGDVSLHQIRGARVVPSLCPGTCVSTLTSQVDNTWSGPNTLASYKYLVMFSISNSWATNTEAKNSPQSSKRLIIAVLILANTKYLNTVFIFVWGATSS